MTNRSSSGLEGELAVLDSISPESHPARDATHFRRIVVATKALRSAEIGLRQAVEAARDAGDSWTIVGAALGMTPYAAQRRFTEALETEVENQ